MKSLVTLLPLALLLGVSAQAGLGIQAGALSPNSALKDNDNSFVFGIDYSAKLAVIGLKIEALYVDSEGRYSKELGDVANNFAEATLNIEGIASADVMFYPLGTTFFVQAGVNYTSIDAEDLVHIDGDVVDNKLGLDLGAGITLFDKLMLQAKVMYTPGALNSDAADALDLNENLLGYLATVGWRF